MSNAASQAGDEQFRLFKSIDELFIPLRHYELVHRLSSECEFSDVEIQQFLKLTDQLASILYIEHMHQWMRIEEQYSRMDPDADIWNKTASNAAIDETSERFFDSLSSLLHSAHYQRLTRAQIEECVSIGGQWGVRLDVDFDFFKHIDVYVRGYRRVKVQRRRWQSLFRLEEIELPEFRRLVLAFRTNKTHEDDVNHLSHEQVYLKSFKDIPETDLEILLPGSTVRLSILDRGKILLPTLSGIAVTVYKIVRAAAVLTLATLAGIWGWVLLIGALTAYIVKSVLGFVRTKDKYRFDLTQNLYLKNLDNNAGVLFRVFSESQEQELSETLIGYAILLKRSDGGMKANALKTAAEDFLRPMVGGSVKFDPDDSLAKLARLGLAEVSQAGLWTALPIERSADVLSDKWQELLAIKPSSGGRNRS